MATAIISVCTLHIPHALRVFRASAQRLPAALLRQLEPPALCTLGRPCPAPCCSSFALPVIWIAHLIWGGLIYVLDLDAPPQPLITLFAEGGNVFGMALMALFAVVLAPISEELLFRGCLYRFLKSQTNISFAFLISGALFAIMHGNLATFAPP